MLVFSTPYHHHGCVRLPSMRPGLCTTLQYRALTNNDELTNVVAHLSRSKQGPLGRVEGSKAGWDAAPRRHLKKRYAWAESGGTRLQRYACIYCSQTGRGDRIQECRNAGMQECSRASRGRQAPCKPAGGIGIGAEKKNSRLKLQ